MTASKVERFIENINYFLSRFILRSSKPPK